MALDRNPVIVPGIKDEGGGGSGSSAINYKINYNALPSWHDKYDASSTNSTDLQFACILNNGPYKDKLSTWNSNGYSSTYNTDATPLVATSPVVVYGAKACDKYKNSIGAQPIYKGTGCFIEGVPTYRGHVEPQWNPNTVLSIERKLNSRSGSYGLYCAEKYVDPNPEWDEEGDPGWLNCYDETFEKDGSLTYIVENEDTLDRRVPYVTYLAVCGAGSGGSAGSSDQRTNGGGGGATFCCLVDWTQIKKLEITLGEGGAGQRYPNRSGEPYDYHSYPGQYSKIKVTQTNDTVGYIYIQGGQPSCTGSSSGWNGDGGSKVIATPSNYSNTATDTLNTLSSNVIAGGSYYGLTCVAVIAGGSGNSNGVGPGNMVSDSSVRVARDATNKVVATYTFKKQPGGLGGESTDGNGARPFDETEFSYTKWNPTGLYLEDAYQARSGLVISNPDQDRMSFMSCGGGASLLGAGGCGGYFTGISDYANDINDGLPGACGGGGGAGVCGFHTHYGAGGKGGNGAIYMTYQGYSA